MRTFFKSRSLAAGVLFFFLFFLSGDIVPQDDPAGKSFAELLDQGRRLYAEKDYENAIVLLLQADALAKTDEEQVDVYFLLSRVYFDFDETEIARDYLRKIMELTPEKTIAEPDVSKGYWKLFQEAKKANEEASPQVAVSRYSAKIKQRRRINKIELIGAIVLLVGLVVVLRILRKKNKNPEYVPDYDTRVMKIEWVTIPEGEFTMGDNFGEGDASELPVHLVYLDRYEISKYEVTYEQFDLFCKESKRSVTANPLETARGSRPVLVDRWDDAHAFCIWLSEKTGKKFRLPTEAQWEKAARGQDQRKYPWGNTEPNCGMVNFNNCVSGTQPVGSYPAGASPYGIMDMAGNAMEWCGDYFLTTAYSRTNAYRNPSLPLSDHPQYSYPIGGEQIPWVSSFNNAVVRGGDYKSSAYLIQALRRSNYILTTNGIGFRVCKK
jgi:formylglycine-generating enzyme required for sulfatase activity